MIVIQANTINFAWYSLLRKLDLAKNTGTIQKGSYEKDDYRLQFDSVAIEITTPYFDMIPIMAVGNESFAPTDLDYVKDYFYNYLMGSEVKENEVYTYGSRINLSINKVIEMLIDCPVNNQMVMDISKPEDINLNDPPCLRLIDIKVVNNTIEMHVYFRSWELWAGLPTNLGGLELLRQYLSIVSGLNETKGKLYAYSSGLHIYGANIKVASIVSGYNL